MGPNSQSSRFVRQNLTGSPREHLASSEAFRHTEHHYQLYLPTQTSNYLGRGRVQAVDRVT
jgi:hypothetical protein